MWFAGFLLYLGTNLDNALVLLVCVANRNGARRQAAFALSTTALIVLAMGLLLSEALDDLGAWPLNLLGLVPLSLGLFALIRGPEALDAVQATGMAALIGLLLSNSSDTLVTLVSFLAERPDAVRVPVAIGYFSGVCVMLAAVAILLDRLATRPNLSRWAARIGPLIMIGFGLFILMDTAGDKL